MRQKNHIKRGRLNQALYTIKNKQLKLLTLAVTSLSLVSGMLIFYKYKKIKGENNDSDSFSQA